MAINDPRDIPGLLVWYSAQAETGYANDAQMTQWTDQSGNGNHATGATTASAKPYWRATDGANAGPAVRFGMSGGGVGATGAYFTIPPAIFAGATAGEVMATVKSDTTAATTSQGHWLKAGSYAGGAQYGYSGTSYDDFGTTARKTLGTLPPINAWHRANIWSAASDYAFRFDGVTKFSTTTNTVGWASVPRLGNTGAPGTVTNQTAETFEGHLGCVVIYSRKLTTTERADLDAWLAANPSGGTATGSTKVYMSATLAGAAGVSATLGLHPASLKAALSPQATLTAGLRQTVHTSASLAAVSDLAATLTIQGRVDLAASLAGAATLAANLQVLHVTDTATPYANDGYNYGGGVSEVDFDPPVAATPAGIRRAKIMRVHQSLPAPNLVDGRPR